MQLGCAYFLQEIHNVICKSVNVYCRREWEKISLEMCVSVKLVVRSVITYFQCMV